MNDVPANRWLSVPPSAIRPPLHEASFWLVQAIVAGLAASHFVVDLVWAAQWRAMPTGLPVALVLVPVGYAALRYGLSGSVPTAVWAVLLWLPDLLLPHNQGHAGDDVIALGLVVAVAVFVGYHIDVERQERAQARRAEREHSAAEARYRQLFDTNAAPILVLNRAGTIVEANPAAQALAPGSVVGEPLTKVLGYGLDVCSDNPNLIVTVGPAPSGPRDYRPSLTRLPSASPDERLTQLVLEDVTEERAEGQRVRRFAELLLNAQEDERRRIARELHDEPLQLLIHLARSLDRFGTLPDTPTTLTDGLAHARHQTIDVADRISALVEDLRPPALEQLGLVATLRGFLVSAGELAETGMDLQVTGNEIRLSPQIELALFRIAQEAVNNVVRHAAADHLWLTLAYGDGGLRLRVADDGHGFDLAAIERRPQAERLGLLGMRERAALLGGRLKIHSTPGKGTIVEAELV